MVAAFVAQSLDESVEVRPLFDLVVVVVLLAIVGPADYVHRVELLLRWRYLLTMTMTMSHAVVAATRDARFASYSAFVCEAHLLNNVWW